MNTNDINQQIANNFYNIALSLAPNPTIKKVIPSEIKDFYVVWDGETVGELALGEKVSEDKKEQKLEKFQYFKEQFLAQNVPATEIYVVNDPEYNLNQIVDGIHRSVGFYMAYLEDNSIIDSTNFTYLLFESNRIRQMGDYAKLIRLTEGT